MTARYQLVVAGRVVAEGDTIEALVEEVAKQASADVSGASGAIATALTTEGPMQCDACGQQFIGRPGHPCTNNNCPTRKAHA